MGPPLREVPEGEAESLEGGEHRFITLSLLLTTDRLLPWSAGSSALAPQTGKHGPPPVASWPSGPPGEQLPEEGRACPAAQIFPFSTCPVSAAGGPPIHSLPFWLLRLTPWSLSSTPTTALSPPSCPPHLPLAFPFFWYISTSRAALSPLLPWLTSCVKSCQGWADGWALPPLCSSSGLPLSPRLSSGPLSSPLPPPLIFTIKEGHQGERAFWISKWRGGSGR